MQTKPMTQAQTKFLLEQLAEVRKSKPLEYQDSGLPKSAKVKEAEKQILAAEKIISEHREADREFRRERTLAIGDGFLAAKRAILFGDAEGAMKAIDKFKATKY